MDTHDLKKLVHFSTERVEREPVHESRRLWSELLCLSRTQRWGPIRDDESDAIFVVIAGEAVFQVASRRKRLRQWGTTLVPAGSELVVTNASVDPLVVLVVASPPPTPHEAD